MFLVIDNQLIYFKYRGARVLHKVNSVLSESWETESSRPGNMGEPPNSRKVMS